MKLKVSMRYLDMLGDEDMLLHKQSLDMNDLYDDTPAVFDTEKGCNLKRLVFTNEEMQALIIEVED